MAVVFEWVDFSELILVGAVSVAFFIFLKYLLRVAEKKFKGEYPIQKEDEFEMISSSFKYKLWSF